MLFDRWLTKSSIQNHNFFVFQAKKVVYIIYKHKNHNQAKLNGLEGEGDFFYASSLLYTKIDGKFCRKKKKKKKKDNKG